MTREITKALDGRRIASQAFVVLIALTLCLPAGTGLAAADASGEYVQVWGEGSKETANECGTVIGPDGDVYACETGGGMHIIKYDATDGSVIWNVTHTSGGAPSVQTQELLSVNSDGLYVASETEMLMVDRADGSFIDSANLPSGWANEPDETSAADGYVTVIEQGDTTAGDFPVYSTSGSGLTHEVTQSTVDGPFTIDIDSSGASYIARGGGGSEGQTASKVNLSGDTVWSTGAGFLPSAGETIDVSGSGASNTVYVGQSDTQVTEITVSSNTPSRGWETNALGGTAQAMSYDSSEGVVAVASGGGKDVYVLNESDGSNAQSITHVGNVMGVSAQGGSIYTQDAGANTQYLTIEPPEVVSIDLSIIDTTILPGDSSSYSVTATHNDSATSDVSGSSNVSADDTSVVTVDEPNTEIDYQSDGTTTVRANYTNASGAVLWDNETVETDTPQISLNLEANPAELNTTHNYTVSQTVFGTTTDVTSSATVTSSNTTVATVDIMNSNYSADTVGNSTLNASVMVSGDTYSDAENLEVITPQALTWANWEFLNSGEKMIVILSDWTVLYLFTSLLISTMLSIALKASRVGLASFGGLVVIGWILGFVPNYAALSLLLFYLFIGFLFTWESQAGGSTA